MYSRFIWSIQSQDIRVFLNFSEFSQLQTRKIPLTKNGTTPNLLSKETFIYVVIICEKKFQIDAGPYPKIHT